MSRARAEGTARETQIVYALRLAGFTGAERSFTATVTAVTYPAWSGTTATASGGPRTAS